MKNFKSRHNDNMKTGKGCSNAMAKMTRILFALVLAAASAVGWYGIADAATCYTCHAPVGSTTDLRPVESTYRNITTGSIIGSHAKHIPSPTTLVSACTPCHVNAASYTTKHRDGFIQVSSVSYSKSAKFPQSDSPILPLGTCSAAACHADPYATTGYVTTPAWGTSAGCNACHSAFPIAATGPATGSHVMHNDTTCTDCHNAGTTATTIPTAGHADGDIDVVGYSIPNLTKHAANTGYTGACSTTTCHGAGKVTPVWGTVSGNSSCTKCHGTGTVTVTASNYEVVAPSGASSDTGKVSTGKIGAHQTHLKYFNGLSQQGTDPQARCQICHTIPGSSNHANGNATPTFTGLALGTGTYATSYSAGTCSVYCHNPAAVTGGTLAATNAPATTTVSWTDAAYIDVTSGLKNDLNCNKCHKSPNGSNVISATTSHASFTIATACTPCHEHEGSTGGSVGRQHMDGIKYGSGGAGGCVGCHGYGVGTWAAAPEIDTVNHQGKGAHEKHITYLTTKRFSITLAPTTDTYNGATTAWTNVCGICHGNTTSNHQNGAVNVSVSATYLFGTGSTIYGGVPGTSSAANAKTCSNISCHYFTTPLWSTY